MNGDSQVDRAVADAGGRHVLRSRSGSAKLVMGVLIGVIASCTAKRETTDVEIAPDRVSSEPALVECAGYRPPPGGVGIVRTVEVQYLVKPDGLVEPTSISVVNRPQGTPAEQEDLMERAREAARNCHYEPARRDGQATTSVVRRIFRFLAR